MSEPYGRNDMFIPTAYFSPGLSEGLAYGFRLEDDHYRPYTSSLAEHRDGWSKTIQEASADEEESGRQRNMNYHLRHTTKLPGLKIQIKTCERWSDAWKEEGNEARPSEGHHRYTYA